MRKEIDASYIQNDVIIRPKTSGLYLFLGYTKLVVKNNRFFAKVNSTPFECSIGALFSSAVMPACLWFVFLKFRIKDNSIFGNAFCIQLP